MLASFLQEQQVEEKGAVLVVGMSPVRRAVVVVVPVVEGCRE